MTLARIENVGDQYDIALGYPRPDGSATQMIGYVESKTGAFTERTNIQDEQHLVQVASPNSTDRFERFPKVTQSDWSGGERQRIFVAPNQYYQGFGVDVTKPGRLTLLPGSSTLYNGAAYDTSTYKAMPAASDGVNWVLGAVSGAANIIENGLASSLAVAQAPEILDALCVPGAGIGATPGYIFVATNAPTPGIWQVNSASSISSVKLIGDQPGLGARQLMAYFQGYLYFLMGNLGPSGNSHIQRIPSALTSDTTVYTADIWQNGIVLLASTATGLVFITGALDTSTPCGQAIVYTFDGATATRIAEFPGYPRFAYEMNGVTYILAEMSQNTFQSAIPHQYTLYALVGNTLSIIDDMRSLEPDFQTTRNVTNTPYASMCGDGRYLYIAIPGLAGILAYDPIRQAFWKAAWDIGQGFPSASTVSAHRVMRSASAGIMDVTECSDGSFILRLFNQTPVTGNLQTSYFDFGTPTVNKVFTALEFDMQTVLDTTAVTAQFRTDNASGWTSLTTKLSPGGQGLICYFPANTKGTRVQLLITLTTQAAIVPVVQGYSISAMLGRVWTVEVVCGRNQYVRAGGGSETVRDPQGLSGMELYANILNTYRSAAGRCVLWIPDPTSTSGVSAINAKLLDYEAKGIPGQASGYRDDVDGNRDMERVVTLTLAEQL